MLTKDKRDDKRGDERYNTGIRYGVQTSRQNQTDRIRHHKRCSCTVLFSRRCRRARGDVQKQQGNLRGLRVAYSAIQRRARAALRLRLVGNHHTLHAPAPSPCVTPPSNAILNAYNRTHRGWMRTRPARVCGGLLLLGPSLSATIMCMTDVPFPRHPDSATRNVVNMPASSCNANPNAS